MRASGKELPVMELKFGCKGVIQENFTSRFVHQMFWNQVLGIGEQGQDLLEDLVDPLTILPLKFCVVLY